MTKQGYTLIEMLFVLAILVVLMLFSVRPRQITPSDKEILYELSILIEKARFEAIQKAQNVSLEFNRNCIVISNAVYFENSGLIINTPQEVIFNEWGNIQKGTTISFLIHQKQYKLVFNVGKGAYHLEKASFCFTGCFVWLGYLFSLHRYYFFNHSTFFKTTDAIRPSKNGNDQYLAGKYGFTLIEMLLSLFISALIISSTSTLFRYLFSSIPSFGQDDLTYAIVSLTEDVNMANEVICKGDTINLKYFNQEFTYSLNQNRLVRTPGFNIYLHHVDDIYFETDGLYLYLNIERGNQPEKYQIGVYFRPQTNGLCEPDSFNDLDDFDDNDITDTRDS